MSLETEIKFTLNGRPVTARVPTTMKTLNMLRDVFNLIWRLDLVLQGEASTHLLDEWSDERREQAKWYIDFSIQLGNVICVTDEVAAAERDARMFAEHAEQAKIGPIPGEASEASMAAISG